VKTYLVLAVAMMGAGHNNLPASCVYRDPQHHWRLTRNLVPWRLFCSNFGPRCCRFLYDSSRADYRRHRCGRQRVGCHHQTESVDLQTCLQRAVFWEQSISRRVKSRKTKTGGEGRWWGEGEEAEMRERRPVLMYAQHNTEARGGVNSVYTATLNPSRILAHWQWSLTSALGPHQESGAAKNDRG
jgi:hypothetical protein